MASDNMQLWFNTVDTFEKSLQASIEARMGVMQIYVPDIVFYQEPKSLYDWTPPNQLMIRTRMFMGLVMAFCLFLILITLFLF